MRIIAGSAKGNKLLSFKGDQIRPTLDRVKETLFNILGNNTVDSRFLDLFAGTGNITIEALSRGAEEAVLSDIASDSQKLILKNLQKCGFGDSKNWELLKMDALKSISTLSLKGRQFNLVYLDPPFDANLYDSCLTKLGNSTILEKDVTVIVEHFFKETLAENYGELKRYREKKIGDSCLSFYTIN
jgi:16S rRNA (guanine966-N2)-methyltransferase